MIPCDRISAAIRAANARGEPLREPVMQLSLGHDGGG